MTLVMRGVRNRKLVSDVGYIPASEIKASGGSQPRNKEGASHLARRGKNTETFLICSIYRYFTDFTTFERICSRVIR